MKEKVGFKFSAGELRVVFNTARLMIGHLVAEIEEFEEGFNYAGKIELVILKSFVERMAPKLIHPKAITRVRFSAVEAFSWLDRGMKQDLTEMTDPYAAITLLRINEKLQKTWP